MRRMVCSLAIAAALAAFPVAPSAQGGDKMGASGCAPGDKIDGSTADQARKKNEAAGYRKVSGLNKGCDNSWHGIAEKGWWSGPCRAHSARLGIVRGRLTARIDALPYRHPAPAGGTSARSRLIANKPRPTRVNVSNPCGWRSEPRNPSHRLLSGWISRQLLVISIAAKIN
jgi:hypothetical protein